MALVSRSRCQTPATALNSPVRLPAAVLRTLVQLPPPHRRPSLSCCTRLGGNCSRSVRACHPIRSPLAGSTHSRVVIYRLRLWFTPPRTRSSLPTWLSVASSRPRSILVQRRSPTSALDLFSDLSQTPRSPPRRCPQHHRTQSDHIVHTAPPSSPSVPAEQHARARARALYQH